MRAKNFKRGDEFWLNVYGLVLAVEPVANSKRVRIQIALVDTTSLEFSDGEDVVAFACRPSRDFRAYRNEGDEDGPALNPDPVHNLALIENA